MNLIGVIPPVFKPENSMVKWQRLKGFTQLLPERGTYVLIIFTPSERSIEIGSLGVQRLKKGYYAYTGSALGKGALSLHGRIKRHLEKNKKKKWHIDFLLIEGDVKIVYALIVPTNERMECEINKHLQEKLNAEVLIPRLGSSDCRSQCGSHLLYLGSDKDILRRVTDSLSEKTKRGILLEF